MDLLAREPARRETRPDLVRRRHVFYVEGYDPRGAEAYHRLFLRESDRFRQQWSVDLTVHPLELKTDHFAHWRLDVKTSSWQVITQYDFLRLERFIRSDMAGPLALHILRGLRWIIDDVVSGCYARIFRASWRFALHLLAIQLLLLACLTLAIVAGLVLGRAVTDGLGLPVVAGVAAALLAAMAALVVLRPLASRGFVIQITNCWLTLRHFGNGRATWIDQVVEAGARRLVTIARETDADELAVVGHSTGGVIATAILARALDLEPDLGRRGPRLVLLTLGSVMPAVALHPAAGRVRDMVKRLAVEPTLTWVDCQSRKDVMNFSHFDPIEDIGVRVDEPRCNLVIWLVRFKDMVSADHYRRLRRNFFRMHFQYINASSRRALYDYVLLVGGPAGIPDWAKRHSELAVTLFRNVTSSSGRASDSADTIAGVTSHP